MISDSLNGTVFLHSASQIDWTWGLLILLPIFRINCTWKFSHTCSSIWLSAYRVCKTLKHVHVPDNSFDNRIISTIFHGWLYVTQAVQNSCNVSCQNCATVLELPILQTWFENLEFTFWPVVQQNEEDVNQQQHCTSLCYHQVMASLCFQAAPWKLFSPFWRYSKHIWWAKLWTRGLVL